MYEEYLIQLGLSKKEAEVYLALLEMGQSPASAIFKKLQLKRTTAYSIMSSLKEKGLVGVCDKNGLLCYAAMDPEVLLERYTQRMRDEQRNFEAVCRVLSRLSLDFGNRNLGSPKLFMVDGIKGIKRLIDDTLSAGKLILRCSSFPAFISRNLIGYFEQCDRIRAFEKNILMKVLVHETADTREYWRRHTSVFTEVRWFSGGLFPFESEVFIYDNKVSVFSFERNDLSGILIENESYANMQRKIFDLAWTGAKALRNGVGLDRIKFEGKD